MWSSKLLCRVFVRAQTKHNFRISAPHRKFDGAACSNWNAKSMRACRKLAARIWSATIMTIASMRRMRRTQTRISVLMSRTREGRRVGGANIKRRTRVLNSIVTRSLERVQRIGLRFGHNKLPSPTVHTITAPRSAPTRQWAAAKWAERMRADFWITERVREWERRPSEPIRKLCCEWALYVCDDKCLVCVCESVFDVGDLLCGSLCCCAAYVFV